jgi:uncharacterized protein with ParB-like and HNH nuclease domain
MGHIANKIDAKDKKLSEVLTGQRYKIDSFQREYRWQRKQIEALISDLSISFYKNYRNNHTIENYSDYDCYYMGPIVLCEDKGILSIVDGQQRLTSFTLLLIYLHHAQKKLELTENLFKDLKPFLYLTKGGKTTLVLNVDSRVKVIEHLYNNPSSIFEVIDELEYTNGDDSKKKSKDESVQNIIERYEDITKLFPEELININTLPLFIEWLLDKIVMVEVKAYSMENAYTIFETMNDRGLTLNPTEILKGFLLSKIDEETKSEEMNEFWRTRIAEIKSNTGIDGDLDFFRAWLRAKYAETIRPKQVGSENEDFEIIGTQFHTWIKNNSNKTFLKDSEDYYFFIRSDFDFYSNLYKQLYNYKNKCVNGFESIYISNAYPIADSLSYPLLISPISKIDENKVIDEKIKLVGKFIDIYTNNRTIQGKAITQSSIRYSIYELVKSIRNNDLDNLKERLKTELDKGSSSPYSSFTLFHNMDNWGYYHYFFARIIYYLDCDKYDFRDLLRTRKQNSFVLYKINNFEEIPFGIEEINWNLHINSVANYCLVRRFDLENINSLNPKDRITYLHQYYMPEMNGYIANESNVIEFIAQRDHVIREIIDKIWRF